jgi:cell division protein FtsB
MRSRRKSLRPFIFLGGVAVIFLMIFFSYAESLWRHHQRNEYHAALEQELLDLQNEKQELAQRLKWVQTPEYRELKAKENLNQRRAGEKVVVITDAASFLEEEEEETPLEKLPPREQWRIFFFGRELPERAAGGSLLQMAR